METLLRDLRHAVRMLGRRPALTAAAVLCMALGIGATTVVFTVINGVLLHPMPYPDADRVVVIWNQFLARGIDRSPSSGKEFEDHRDDDQAFEELAGMIHWHFNLTGEGEPERLMGGRVSAGLFPLLGVGTAAGRVFTAEEQKREERLVVLSHGLWQRRFNGDEGVLGRAILLNHEPYTVIGVLEEGFEQPIIEAELWVPLVVNPRIPRNVRGVQMLGRVRRGLSLEQAQAQMDAVAARFQDGYPDLYPPDSGWGIRLVPIKEEVVGDVGPQLWILFAVVGLVLLIACANVANLLLAQATARSKEMAIRIALGAGRGGMVRQLLTESVVLALVGGGVGLLLAFWGTQGLVRLDVGDLPRLAEVGVDGWVLGFVVLVSALTGVVFGLVPALQSLRPDLRDNLKEGGKTSAAGGRHPLLEALVVAEVALALAVLVATGLMLRSFQRLAEMDLGYRTEGLLTVDLTGTIGLDETADRINFHRRLLASLESTPGVRRLGMGIQLPPSAPLFQVTAEAEARAVGPGEHNPEVDWNAVSPGYFEVLGIPLVEGRLFDSRDHEEALDVAIVDERVARRLWPEESPLDKRLRLRGFLYNEGWLTVVGVVRHVRNRGPAMEAVEQVYVPFLQAPGLVMNFALETVGEPLSVAPAVRQAVWAVDPNQPVERAQTMEERLGAAIARPRLHAFLLSLFGAVALTLAAVGIYGVMSYTVAQRTREVGLRMALGAVRGEVQALVVRRGLMLVGLGVGLGLAVALVLVLGFSRLLGDLFYGMRLTDLTTFIGVPVVLAAVAVLASYLPARRASRVDPMVALRYE